MTTGIEMPARTAEEKLAHARKAKRMLDRKAARQKAEELERMMTELYEKPVEEWDWEELSMGQPRREDGSFAPNPPKWVTPTIQAEVQRRMRTMSEKQLMRYAFDAIRTLSDVMTDNDVDDFGKPVVPASVKVDAAKYILNHVIGTPKARVEINESNPLVELMGGILVNPDGSDAHPIIEGEILDEEDGEGGE